MKNTRDSPVSGCIHLISNMLPLIHFWYIKQNIKTGFKTNTIWTVISTFYDRFPCFRPCLPCRPIFYSFNLFESTIGNVNFFFPFCFKKQEPRVSWTYIHYLFQEIWCTLEHIWDFLFNNKCVIGIFSPYWIDHTWTL